MPNKIVSYTEYCKLGYTAIPETEFTRYEAKAFLTVQKYTFGRVDESNATEDNRRGICELADLYYSDDKQINKPILSFTNDKYSEMYALPSQVLTQTVHEKAWAVVNIYFTREQLYRGV